MTPDNGLITLASAFSVKETVDRLSKVVLANGLTVFARIDHGGNAKEVGMELRPTELLIFGNPKGGTPLMQERQTSGIELPVKALAWEDADGRVWLTYNDPRWLAKRHQLAEKSEAAMKAMEAGMAALTKAATIGG
jgi:uncharacterized protein (DUF302 family)